MAITTGIQIVVIFSGASEQDVPPPVYIFTPKSIRLIETTKKEYKLISVMGNETSEIPLSEENVQQLAGLINQLPDENMFAPARSFDGIVYDLVLMHAKKTIIYQWKNKDWRFIPDQLQETWVPIQAFADSVEGLSRSERL
jgi:hypothetical protein